MPFNTTLYPACSRVRGRCVTGRSRRYKSVVRGPTWSCVLVSLMSGGGGRAAPLVPGLACPCVLLHQSDARARAPASLGRAHETVTRTDAGPREPLLFITYHRRSRRVQTRRIELKLSRILTMPPFCSFLPITQLYCEVTWRTGSGEVTSESLLDCLAERPIRGLGLVAKGD